MTLPKQVLETQRAAILTQLLQYYSLQSLTQWQTAPTYNDAGAQITAGTPITDGDGNPKSSIILLKKGDVFSATQRALNNTGVSIAMFYSDLKNAGDGNLRVFFDEVHFQLEIAELVTVNQGSAGSGLSAEYLVEQCMAALNQFQVPTNGVDGGYPIQCIGARNVTTSDDATEGYDIWLARFQTRATLQTRPTP